MVSFYHCFRPTITSVEVRLFENGIAKPIGAYSELQIVGLCNAIEKLWMGENKSPYWFETDVYEYRSCFTKHPPTMVVRCYTEDVTARNFKKDYPIPTRFRKRMFDKYHDLTPEAVGMQTWPKLQVKFVLKE